MSLQRRPRVVELGEMERNEERKERERKEVVASLGEENIIFYFGRIQDSSSDTKMMGNQHNRDSLPRVSHPKHTDYKTYQK